MSQALHPCVYAPLCSQVFAQHWSMLRHAENHHGGVNKIFCLECERLVFFKSVKSLRDHKAKVHTEQVACSSCDTMVKPRNLMKHMKRHPDAASFEAEDEDEEDDVQDEVEDKLVSVQLKYLIEPGVFIEREGKTRSEKCGEAQDFPKSELPSSPPNLKISLSREPLLCLWYAPGNWLRHSSCSMKVGAREHQESFQLRVANHHSEGWEDAEALG
ncbi:hypothetical protein FI667_g10486, partial [Globisporangium splendens]